MISFFAIALLASACTDRQHRNPLDPLTTDPLDNSTPIDAVAGDGVVSLAWDYSQFQDLSGYRLQRTAFGADGRSQQLTFHDLSASTLQFEDIEVTNGHTYQYRLSLVVDGDGELELADIQLATPGPEIAWAADRGSGLVWKLSPDGRNGLFASGRFSIGGMAVSQHDRSCWVSDVNTGLHRIDAEGQVDAIESEVMAAGALSFDPDGTTGWVADREDGAVYSFSANGIDSLDLVQVDASFLDPFQLAAIEGGCWVADRGVADREQGRILLYSVEGSRIVDWRGMSDLLAIAASGAPLLPEGGNVIWVIADAGETLLRLEVGAGEGQELDLPFDRAIDVDVDDRTGVCWVLGERDIALFSVDGIQVTHRSQFDLGAVSLTVDGINQSVWIAAANAVLKLSIELEGQTRLDGFTSTLGIAVDPGSR